MEFFSRCTREVRRAAILANKRWSLFQYNVALKQKQGGVYNPGGDAYMMERQQRSLNLLDFSANQDKDLFLIDIYSDRTEYGGVSETGLELRKSEGEEGEAYLQMRCKFQQDQTGLVPIDYMFCGFQCINLVKLNYDYFNGFRITMEKPQYPCKFGAHIQTSLKEYEHYAGHLVDTTPRPHSSASGIEWVEYEIPIWLMMQSTIG